MRRVSVRGDLRPAVRGDRVSGVGEQRADELWPGMRILLERREQLEEAEVRSVSHRRNSPYVTVRVTFDRDGQDARLSMYGPGTVPVLATAAR
jgi:hypothetical protein